MWWLVLEASIALGLLAFMVWWTMFSGRRPRDAGDPEFPGDRDD
jgi:hypothetical protein